MTWERRGFHRAPSCFFCACSALPQTGQGCDNIYIFNIFNINIFNIININILLQGRAVTISVSSITSISSISSLSSMSLISSILSIFSIYSDRARLWQYQWWYVRSGKVKCEKQEIIQHYVRVKSARGAPRNKAPCYIFGFKKTSNMGETLKIFSIVIIS